jgi:hypothetical protein
MTSPEFTRMIIAYLRWWGIPELSGQFRHYQDAVDWLKKTDLSGAQLVQADKIAREWVGV